MIFVLLLAPVLGAQEIGSNCASCHSEHVEQVKSHKHGMQGIGCEVCHGASERHRKAVGASPPDRVAAPDELPALCGGCHAPQRKAFEASVHGKLVLARERAAHCGTCHGVHAARSVDSMQRQCSRCHRELPAACKATPKREAKLLCAGCHEPHSLLRQ